MARRHGVNHWSCMHRTQVDDAPKGMKRAGMSVRGGGDDDDAKSAVGAAGVKKGVKFATGVRGGEGSVLTRGAG